MGERLRDFYLAYLRPSMAAIGVGLVATALANNAAPNLDALHPLAVIALPFVAIWLSDATPPKGEGKA